MRQKTYEIRSWLQEHKIFFEAFSLVGLGAMSIILSCVSLKISAQQVVVAKMEAAAAHAAQSPFLVVTSYLMGNDSTKVYDDEIITISNEGSPLEDFDSDIRVFFHIEKQGIPGPCTAVRIPVLQYFFVTRTTESPTGLLAVHSGDDNNAAFASLYMDFIRLSQIDATVIYKARRITVVRARYRDYTGDYVTKYYIVPPERAGHEILSSVGQRYFDEFDDDEVHWIPLSVLTQAAALDYLARFGAPQK